MRILVADDHPMNRRMMKMLLGALGHSVDVVEDGAEACRATETQAYDLVLMDLHMPVMDGAEAVALIRSGPRPAPRLVIVTADHSDESAARCHAAGADAVETKPLDVGKLTLIVSAATAGLVGDGDAGVGPGESTARLASWCPPLGNAA